MSIWVLTEWHNDYNQYGDYFLEAWTHKPTEKDLNDYLSYTRGWEAEYRKLEFEKLLQDGGCGLSHWGLKLDKHK